MHAFVPFLLSTAKFNDIIKGGLKIVYERKKIYMSIKVAQVVTLSEMGGAQKHVLLLSTELKSRGYDVTIFTSAGGKLIEKARENGISVVLVPDMVREISPVSDIKAVRNLYRLFKEGGFDIVHSHSSKAGILARIAAKLAGTKRIIYTAHGFVFNEPMSSIKRAIYIYIERIGAMLGDKVISVSKKDLDSALENRLVSGEKLVYIPNAIPEISKESLRDAAEVKKELGIPEGEFVIGTISNFYETKGHIYLIEAVKRLHAEGHSFRTVFAGQGPKMQEMMDISGGDKGIMFLGYREDNYDIMNTLDLFVLPSIKEGMPYVVLEAMSLGKPVLCTKVGALTDMIEDGVNGFIVEPQDSGLIYEKLKWILGNRDSLQPVGAAGEKYVKDNFSMSKFTESVISVYEEA
jgi:glycosyltransferase involved in cell wall biosynthesis